MVSIIGGGNVSGGGGLSRAAPPPQMHSQNMLRDSPSARRIFGALCSHVFVGSREDILCP